MIVLSGAARRGGAFDGRRQGQASHLGGWGNAPPRCRQFAQSQEAPHLHDGPHLHASGWMAHLQAGAQVQGVHLQILVIDVLRSFALWSAWSTMQIGWAIERSG
jgi:hypothetical protein